jgi:hypothetical protein
VLFLKINYWLFFKWLYSSVEFTSSPTMSTTKQNNSAVPPLTHMAAHASDHPVVWDALQWGAAPQVVAQELSSTVEDYDISHIPRAFGWLQPEPIPEWKSVAQQHGYSPTLPGPMLPVVPHHYGVEYNPYKQDAEYRLDGAHFRDYDEHSGLRIRVDHATCPEFWLEITLPVEMMRAPSVKPAKFRGLPMRGIRHVRGRFPFRSPRLYGKDIRACADVRRNDDMDDWDFTIFLPEIPLGQVVFSYTEFTRWAATLEVTL